MTAEIFVSVVMTPKFPLVLGMLIATGMLIGGLMRETGWGHNQFLVWFASGLIYTVGVLFGFRVTSVAGHTEAEWLGLISVIVVTGVGYILGMVGGAHIVSYAKELSRRTETAIDETVEKVVSEYVENGRIGSP